MEPINKAFNIKFFIACFLWIGIWITHIFSLSFSLFPNQLYYSFALLFIILNISILKNKKLIFQLIYISLLFISHVLAFLIVSIWELIPGTTIRHLPFYFVNIFNIICGVAFGFNNSETVQVKIYEISAWFIIGWTIFQFYMFPYFTRFGYGTLSMFLLPFLFVYKRFTVAILLFTFMLFSNHLTPLIAAFCSTVLAVFTKYRFKIILIFQNFKLQLLSFILILVVLTPVFYDYFFNTMKRLYENGLSLQGQDDTRIFISQNSINLLKQTFGVGIGYMNFYAWSGINTGYKYVTRTGYIEEGINLHNSYMTWFLEGGFLGFLTILILFFFTIKKVKIISRLNSIYGAGLIGIFSGSFIFGLSHQLHNSPHFWVFVGIIWGYSARLKKFNHYLG